MFKKIKQLNLMLSIIIFYILNICSVDAAMQSDSYVIYENVRHSFDGPVISNVSNIVNESNVTVAWNTNVLANSYVIYDVDNSFANSLEQGSGLKNFVNHSVVLSGLSDNTTYYYKVKSERLNGGLTVDSSIYSFTTGSTASESGSESSSSNGGGGVLIIDKTDKFSPEISEIKVEVGFETTSIFWKTNEESSSFVEYGKDEDYGNVYGDWKMLEEHQIVLKNLEPNRQYHFRVLSSDDWGNLGQSDDDVFVTLNSKGEIDEPIDWEEDKKENVDNNPQNENKESSSFDNLRKFVGKIFPSVTLNTLSNKDLENINSMDDLVKFTPTPLLMGEPRVEVGKNEVKIFWDSDVDSNSMIAYAPENLFNASDNDPYLQVVGKPEEYVTKHEVAIYNLKPNTVYHYQVQGKEKYGFVAKSRDFTFKTGLETLTINSFLSQVEDDYTAIFKWVTNKESDSQVRIAPYQNNVLAIDEAKIFKDNSFGIIHEIKIEEFKPGIFYKVELFSMNESGDVVTEVIDHFSTIEDDLPPVISHIKSDSTVFIDKDNKIQTVISWITNEPTTSKIYYQEGVHGANVELSESTEMNTDYTKEHIFVVTKFKPGVVYSFRAESIDSGGNVTLSKAHTFKTAKKKESIIQLIIKILEDTFGWIKDFA